MQMHYLHKNIYRLHAYARTQETLEKYQKRYQNSVSLWEKLKNEGVCVKTCQEVTGISRATYYRRKRTLNRLLRGIAPPSKKPKKLHKPKWGEAQKQLVLQIRRANPTYGKEKIAVILRRDHGQTLRESTVGRILTYLKEKGLIVKSLSALRAKRKRHFKTHSTPWNYKDYKTMVMGERVQVDHMTVTKNGIGVKHFQAWDRKTKSLYAQVYSHATSASAKKFLKELILYTPFKIHSLQVDGGSEFMGEFEKACQEMGIPLLVLPPKMPVYNGGVERGNRTFREEFYALPWLRADSIGAMRYELKRAVEKYNTYRPHRALKGLTPMEYIQSTLKAS